MVDNSPGVRSKLELDEAREIVAIDVAITLVSDIFEALGCCADVAREVARHLADANLCGMESHGLMRTLQYADQFLSGYMRADARAEIVSNDRGATLVDGHGGIGIPAMRIAVEEGNRQARAQGRLGDCHSQRWSYRPPRRIHRGGRERRFSQYLFRRWRTREMAPGSALRRAQGHVADQSLQHRGAGW